MVVDPSLGGGCGAGPLWLLPRAGEEEADGAKAHSGVFKKKTMFMGERKLKKAVICYTRVCRCRREGRGVLRRGGWGQQGQRRLILPQAGGGVAQAQDEILALTRAEVVPAQVFWGEITFLFHRRVLVLSYPLIALDRSSSLLETLLVAEEDDSSIQSPPPPPFDCPWAFEAAEEAEEDEREEEEDMEEPAAPALGEHATTP